MGEGGPAREVVAACIDYVEAAQARSELPAFDVEAFSLWVASYMLSYHGRAGAEEQPAAAAVEPGACARTVRGHGEGTCCKARWLAAEGEWSANDAEGRWCTDARPLNLVLTSVPDMVPTD